MHTRMKIHTLFQCPHSTVPIFICRTKKEKKKKNKTDRNLRENIFHPKMNNKWPRVIQRLKSFVVFFFRKNAFCASSLMCIEQEWNRDEKKIDFELWRKLFQLTILYVENTSTRYCWYDLEWISSLSLLLFFFFFDFFFCFFFGQNRLKWTLHTYFIVEIENNILYYIYFLILLVFVVLWWICIIIIINFIVYFIRTCYDWVFYLTFWFLDSLLFDFVYKNSQFFLSFKWFFVLEICWSHYAHIIRFKSHEKKIYKNRNNKQNKKRKKMQTWFQTS